MTKALEHVDVNDLVQDVPLEELPEIDPEQLEEFKQEAEEEVQLRLEL